MPDETVYDNSGRRDRFWEAIDALRAEAREARAEHQADQRIQAIYYADAAAWRVDVKVRLDELSKAVAELKLDVASRTASSPVTAAMSAAGGGGGALILYMVAKAVGILPGVGG